MSPFSSDDDCALLLRTLENGGVEIRIEKCEGDGGLVRRGDRYTLFVPANSPSQLRRGLYLNSIRKLSALRIPLSPRVRQLLGEEEWNGKT